MTKHTEVMKLALEALEAKGDAWIVLERKAIAALREALAEQPAPATELREQEPCGWQFFQDGKWHNGMETNNHRANTEAAGVPVRDVYPSPPAQRTWVGLTDVEWMNIVNKDQAWFGQRPDEVAHEVAKLVEAKLKEKNA